MHLEVTLVTGKSYSHSYPEDTVVLRMESAHVVEYEEEVRWRRLGKKLTIRFQDTKPASSPNIHLESSQA